MTDTSAIFTGHQSKPDFSGIQLRRYPMPMPFGWYCVEYSDRLKVKESKPLRYFDTDLVLFRTESGQAVVLDAYCPHLGAHLGHGIHEDVGAGGRVEGETIVCPFHAWRFNPQGECVEIPYAKNLPPKIQGKQCLNSWQVREANQVIYVWYHPEGLPPQWEVEEYEEANSDEWGELQRFEWVIKTHMQEMSENAADPAHFRYVHRTQTMPKWNIEYDGHIAVGLQKAKMKTPRGEVNGEIHTRSSGPGNGRTRFRGICETFLMGLTLPISQQEVHVRFAFIQKKDDTNSGVGRAIIRDVCRQLEEDKPIWEHKIYRPLPVLCDGDGPIAKFRRWYSQFYAGFDPNSI